MDKERLEQFKNRLLAEKENIEHDLREFAVENPKGGTGWEVKRPDFGVSKQDDEELADEVEEYVSELSIEQQLASRLKEINAALTRIDKGTYGVCERCRKDIDLERLKANPEARTHTSCNV